MSARTPFVPAVSRPDSQMAHILERTNGQKTSPAFLGDPANPLHSSSNSAVEILPNAPQTTRESTLNFMNKGPLNTSSLIKSTRLKKDSQGSTKDQNRNENRRPSLTGSTPIRSGTADPFSKAGQDQRQAQISSQINALDIVAPVARQATLLSFNKLTDNVISDVFTTTGTPSAFRIPALPAGQLPESMPEERRDAHISNSVLGFSFSNPQANTESSRSQLLTPPTSVHRADTSANLTDNNVPLTLNMSHPNKPGPQRVLLNPDGTRGPLVDHGLDIPDRTASALKRYRLETEDSESSDHKRIRNEDSVYGQREASAATQLLTPDHHPIGSRNSKQTPDVLAYKSNPSYQPYSAPMTPPGDLHHMQSSYNCHNPHISDPSGLDKLLGCDVEGYIEEHLEDYKQSVTRWKQCTVDEWLAGAQEHADRFSKILEFVKDHMTTKMKLFASFDARVCGHNAVLTEREKTLDVVRERLVKESSSVVGTGLQQEYPLLPLV